ncbi:MAG: glycerol kinase GlpK, partial [Oscillospiraceae bacterium]
TIYNAIVWQCRRTADYCQELKQDTQFTEYIKENTGLIVDPYFSATKIKWILDNVKDAKQKAKEGKLIFGTIDSYLVYKLTEGKAHITDYTNASRTMLYNIKNLCWDKAILKRLDIPESMLPSVKSCSEIYGYTNIMGVDIPIAGIAGDQQSALFGQLCLNKGDIKNTYGTGNFILMNTGDKPIISKNQLLTTIACGINGNITYAIEGSVFIGGAVLQWLRDELGFYNDSADADYFGSKVSDSGGVYFVPAFTGLAAPYWDMYARGSILGLTRGTTKNHIIRAALNAIAFQTKDVLDAMIADTNISIDCVKVDGGASVSDIIMQFQADIINKNLIRPKIRETTALGVAYLAGLATGFYENIDTLYSLWKLDKTYSPQMEEATRKYELDKWHLAVNSTRMFTSHQI